MQRARSRFESGDDAGQDSFLDIVANIVGILILLVMVVGVRAARRPAADRAASDASVQEESTGTRAVAVAETESTEVERRSSLDQAADEEAEAAALAEADAAAKRVATLAVETGDVVSRARQAKSELAFQDGVRVQLATFVAQAEQQLAEKRDELADNDRQDYDSRVAIAEAQRRLDELTRERTAQFAAETQVEVVESLPTPLAKTVDGDEMFLMLSEGKVAVIPLDALREQLYAEFERRVKQLMTRDSISFLVGPIGGFRMRFLAEKVRIASPNGYRIVARPMWELMPNEDRIAEPVDVAIEEGSALMTELAAYTPRRTTVTVVTYADSFNEYRTLKKALYAMGYPVAGRPQPLGKPVIGSPQGTRSAAQ